MDGPNSKCIFGLFGWHEFGFGFGFEGVQIQILYLDKLKEMDLDLVPNPIRI